MALRVAPVPDATVQLGASLHLRSRGRSRQAPDEISQLFRDGTLAATMAKYSYFGLESEWATYDLMEAAERARWISWTVGIVGIALVVTLWQAASLRQRKRSEAALRVSEERFRAIFHQAAVGDAQVTLEGEVTTVNDRYCEVFGYSREELIGRRLVDKAHSDDCASVLANRRRLIERRYPVLLHGTPRPSARTEASPGSSCTNPWCAMASDRPTCTIALVEDITERKHSDAALVRERKTLSQSRRRGPRHDLGFRYRTSSARSSTRDG